MHKTDSGTVSYAALVVPILAIGLFRVATGVPLPQSAAPPVGPFTMPSAETRPSRPAFSSWETAAMFRLEAMRCAAAEAPLPEELKKTITERVSKARVEVDRVGTRYAAGQFRTSDARKAVEAIMGELKLDLAETLGDRAAAFTARVDKTMGDVQLFTDPAGGELVVDAAVKPDDAQKARIIALLNETGKQLEKIDKGDPGEILAARHELGFSTRAAIRALLTPEQLKALDGPFEAPSASAGSPATEPIPLPPGQSQPGMSEAQAIALTRLEALRYAVTEGPYSQDEKAALTDRIAVGTDQVKVSSTTAPASGFGADDEHIGRIYASVLDAASEVLHDKTPALIRRQGRIYQDVTDLSTGEAWTGRSALESQRLSASQRAEVDRCLTDCLEQLNALDAKPGRSRLTFDFDPPKPQKPKERYADFFASDRTLGPAARSLRRRKVAFETRAVLRAILTPEQRAGWDAGESN